MVNWPAFRPVRGRASCAAMWALREGSWRQAGDGGPEDPGVADCVQVQLFGLDLQVRGRGEPAVEVEREFIRCGLDGTEGGGSLPGRRRDEGIVHAEFAQFAVQEAAEGIIAGAGDHAGAAAVAGGSNGHVGGRTSQVLAEGGYILQTDSDVVRVDINADAPDCEQFVGHGTR